MLLQTREIEISNCTFANIIHGPMQIFSVRNEYKEGMMPKDVLIKNNKYLSNAGGDINVFVQGSSGSVPVGVIKNVRAENNFIYGAANASISYSGAGGTSTIKNNLVAYSGNISISYSTGVTIAGNTVVDTSQKATYSTGSGNGSISDGGSNTATKLSKPSIIYDSRK